MNDPADEVDDSVIQRFWAKVDKNGPVSRLGTRCWVWTAGHNQKGYGIFALRKRHLVVAHAFAWWLQNGVWLRGLDHRCHTPPCVNPAHLRHVSNKQNIENRAGLNKNNTSGVRGLTWDGARGRWRASVGHHGRTIFVGRFKVRADAEAAVVAKRNELFTHNEMDRRDG